jgi:hypothetical protein
MVRQLFLAFALAACGTTPDAAPDAPADLPDAPAELPDVPAELPDAPVELDAGPVPEDAPPATTGTVRGAVTRSAMPAAGGRGSLYIAVFTTDPVIDRMGAMNVANARIEGVDMSAPGVSVPYEVTGIPPRPAPYFIVAFLDDNNTVGSDPSMAGPDRGDLVALESFASPRVTVADTTPVSRDLVLNFNLPF